MTHFNVLYCDSDLLVIDKPHDLLCVPGLSEPDNLLDAARAHHPGIRTVHRLDMATSGVIIYALNHRAQKHLGRQFETRQVHKRYSAIVHGRVTQSSGEIGLPLACDWPMRPRQKVDWHAGRSAHTYFEVTAREGDFTELCLYPVTGRSHQLRVHCQALGHPMVGDNLYCPQSQAPRLMLHAECIAICHPSSGKALRIRCPSPFTLSDVSASVPAI